MKNNHEPTMEELCEVIKQIKSTKAADHDRIELEMLKNMEEKGTKLFRNLQEGLA